MSLHFNAFGQPCLDNTSETAPGKWTRRTPLDGEEMQKSLDALLMNDIVQESSCSHITVVNYPNDPIVEGDEGTYNISNIRMNDRDGFVVMTGTGWRHSNIIDAPDVVNDSIDLGILPPAPPELSGVDMQLAATVDNNGETHIKWVNSNDMFSFRVDADTDIKFERIGGTGISCTLGSFDLSELRSDDAVISFIKLRINGEIGFRNDSTIEACSGAMLALPSTHACINSYYINKDKSTSYLNITPVQRVQLASDTNLQIVTDLIMVEAASRNQGADGLYAAAVNNGVTASATMINIGYSKAPFNLDFIVDGEVLQNAQFSVGLSAAFCDYENSFTTGMNTAYGDTKSWMTNFNTDNLEITWNAPKSWFVDVYYNNKRL